MSALTCNCRAELEEKLTERFKAQAPEAAEHDVSLEGYGFGISTDCGVVQRGLMTYSAKATYTSKTGNVRRKTTKGNMVFSYCPFCGVEGQP